MKLLKFLLNAWVWAVILFASLYGSRILKSGAVVSIGAYICVFFVVFNLLALIYGISIGRKVAT